MKDFTSKCRLCLDPVSRVATNLFHSKNGLSYAHQILGMLEIELEDTENLPKRCCPECICFLDQLIRFQKKITENHNKFNQIRSTVQQCRLCLATLHSRESVNLFVAKEGVIFANLIRKMLNVDLEDNPHLPRMGCPKCIDFLTVIPFFQQQILASNKILNDQMRDTEDQMTVVVQSSLPKSEESNYTSIDSLKTEKGEILQQVLEDPLSQDFKPTDTMYVDEVKNATPEELESVDSPVNSKRKRKIFNNSVVRETGNATAEELELETLMLEMRIFHCRVCDVDQKTLWNLRHHVRAEHDYKAYTICCESRIGTAPHNIYDHFRVHLDKDAFKCQECGLLMSGSYCLKTHMNSMHSKKPPSHICNICGKGFWINSYYEVHMTAHGKIKCEHCGKEYASKYLLSSHIKMEHAVEVNCLCHICGRGFPTAARLSVHISDHGGPHGGNRKKKKFQRPPPTDFDQIYFQK